MKTNLVDPSAKRSSSIWAIRPLVPEEVYSNREEHLEYLYNAAMDAIGRRTMSSVLLGQRRMGKTEIFKRLVNTFFSDRITTKKEISHCRYPSKEVSCQILQHSFCHSPQHSWGFSTGIIFQPSFAIIDFFNRRGVFSIYKLFNGRPPLSDSSATSVSALALRRNRRKV